MKINKLFCAVIGAAIALASCAHKKGSEMTQNNEEKGKVLITYFSATGTTRNAAAELAEVIGADTFEIKPEKPYTSADLDWTDSTSRCFREMHTPGYRPAIAGTVSNMADYDTVFVGFPVWWYVAPTIINTFIESNDLEGKTVVCFATSGGSPIEPCVDSLRTQYPAINWANGRLLNKATRKDLREWKQKLGL